MAIQAKTHVKGLHLLDLAHILDVAMAALAGDPLGDVRPMVEEDEIRLVMHLDPLEGLALLVLALQFLDPGAVGLHNAVAIHANIHGRDLRMAAFVGAHMAIKARDVVVPRMNFMAERNGLLGGITDVIPQIPPEVGGIAETSQDKKHDYGKK